MATSLFVETDRSFSFTLRAPETGPTPALDVGGSAYCKHNFFLQCCTVYYVILTFNHVNLLFSVLEYLWKAHRIVVGVLAAAFKVRVATSDSGRRSGAPAVMRHCVSRVQRGLRRAVSAVIVGGQSSGRLSERRGGSRCSEGSGGGPATSSRSGRAASESTREGRSCTGGERVERGTGAGGAQRPVDGGERRIERRVERRTRDAEHSSERRVGRGAEHSVECAAERRGVHAVQVGARSAQRGGGPERAGAERRAEVGPEAHRETHRAEARGELLLEGLQVPLLPPVLRAPVLEPDLHHVFSLKHLLQGATLRTGNVFSENVQVVCFVSQISIKRKAYPDARLSERNPGGDLFAGGHVGVSVALEARLELLQLGAREVRPLPPHLLAAAAAAHSPAATAGPRGGHRCPARGPGPSARAPGRKWRGCLRCALRRYSKSDQSISQSITVCLLV